MFWKYCLTIVFILRVGSEGVPVNESCHCEWRYVQHYTAKGCKATEWDDCNCPTQFNCQQQETQSNVVCMYQTSEFSVGSVVPVRDPCLRCKCGGASDPRIQCLQRECPPLSTNKAKDCFPVFQENRCCPSEYRCRGNTSMELLAENPQDVGVCERGGVQYPVGARVVDPDDVCLVCQCVQTMREECYRRDCVLEKDWQRLARGCVPVYHEKKCCPIEYFCPEDLVNLLGTVSEEISENAQCVFDGKAYSIGDELPHSNKCVHCRCTHPPDFTCIHKHCPLHTNCTQVQQPDDCCTHIQCPTDEDQNACLTECPEHCASVKPHGRRCPICVCRDLEDDLKMTLVPGLNYSEVRCATPLCAENCVAATPPGHVCSICACADSPNTLTVTLFSEERMNGSASLENVTDTTHNPETDGTEVMKPVQINSERESEHEVEGSLNEMESLQPEREEMPKSSSSERESLVPGGESVECGESLAECVLENSNELMPKILPVIDSIKRRRRNSQRNPNPVQVHYQQWPRQVIQSPQQQYDYSTDEREREDETDSNEGGFDDLKIMNGRSNNAGMLIHLSEEEARSVVWTENVPGCPSPLCEGPSCRIGIPPGGRCPTCICKRHRQP